MSESQNSTKVPCGRTASTDSYLQGRRESGLCIHDLLKEKSQYAVQIFRRMKSGCGSGVRFEVEVLDLRKAKEGR